MKFAAIVAVLLSSACSGESITNDIKITQMYNTYMVGQWYAQLSCCGKTELALEPKLFKDMWGRACKIRNIKMTDETIMVVQGGECTSEGKPSSNMTLLLKPNDDDTISYRYSEVAIWQTLKQCSHESKRTKT